LSRFCLGVLAAFLLAAQAFAFSFLVFGDSQGDDKVFSDLISRIKQERNVAFAVNNGDMTVYGKESEYQHYLQMVSKFKYPIYHVMGNHDAVRGGWKNFEKYFGPSYYSFEYQNSHFIILDNSFRQSFDRKQFEWLKKDIASSPARHKFVFMHRPTFDPSEIYQDYTMSGREVTQELMRLFTKFKVEYVFAGHIHGYARAEREGVSYIVTAGAGAPLYLPAGMGGFYNYVKVTVEDGRVGDQVVNIYE